MGILFFCISIFKRGDSMKKSLRGIGILLVLVLFLSCVLTGCSSNGDGEKAVISSMDDLEEKKVAVVTGMIFDQVLKEMVPSAVPTYFNNYTDSVSALKTGKVSALLCDEPVSRMLRMNNEGIRELPAKMRNDSYAFAVNPKEEDLLKRINEVILALKEDGTLEEMDKRWFSNDPSDRVMPDIKLTGENGTLNFGTAAITEPFTYIDDSMKPVGYDIELAARIAEALGMNLNVSDMDFGGLIPALQSGKLDMAGCCITVTEERTKQINFTESYYEGGIVILVTDSEEETGFSSFQDLAGKNVGILTGSIFDSALESQVTGANLSYYNTLADQTVALKSKKLDAYVDDEPAARMTILKNPDLAMLPGMLTPMQYAFAVEKDNTEMAEEWNREIFAMKEEGVFQTLDDKWFSEDDTGKVLTDVDFTGDRGVLKFGTASVGPPFSYVDGTQKPVGYDIDTVRILASRLGYSGVEIISYDFGALIPALQSGKIDMTGSCMAVTEERKEQVLFLEPNYEGGVVVIVRREDLKSSANLTISDLPDSRVGAMTGSTGEIIIESQYPTANLNRYDDIVDAAVALKGNKLDFVITAYTTAMNLKKNNPDLAILPDQLSDESASIGIQKGNTDLKEQINALIKKYEEDGTLDEIKSHWLMEEGDYILADIPEVAEGPVLTVGVAANREPMCFVMDNEIVGLDCELIRHVAYDLGMKVEFSDMKFSSLVPALQSGKVDTIISNVTATEERLKQVDFSDSYFTNPQVLLVKDTGATVEEIPWYQKIINSFYSNLIEENRYQLILSGLWKTVVISVLSAILGTLIGFLICLMKMSKLKLLSKIGSAYIRILQGTPVVVLLLIVCYVIFAKVQVNEILIATITFGANFGAYVAEILRTGISAVDPGQLEASAALGFNKFKTFRHITLPQALKHALPVYKGEFISMVKMTSVAGYIAIQDLTKASDIIRSRTYEAFFPLILVAVIYFLISYLLTSVLTLVEFKIDPKHRKREVKFK